MVNGTAKTCQTCLGVEIEAECTPVETDDIDVPLKVKDSYLDYKPPTLSRVSVFYSADSKLPFSAHDTAIVDETINVGGGHEVFKQPTASIVACMQRSGIQGTA